MKKIGVSLIITKMQLAKQINYIIKKTEKQSSFQTFAHIAVMKFFIPNFDQIFKCRKKFCRFDVRRKDVPNFESKG